MCSDEDGREECEKVGECHLTEEKTREGREGLCSVRRGVTVKCEMEVRERTRERSVMSLLARYGR